MAISEMQRRLVKELVNRGVGEENGLGIVLMMDTPERQRKMLDYMLSAEEPKDQYDLLEKALEIDRSTEPKAKGEN